MAQKGLGSDADRQAAENAPKGFVFLAQWENCTETEARKKALKLTGLTHRELHFLSGHYYIAKKGVVKLVKDGYRVYAPVNPNGEMKTSRMVFNPKTKKEEPAIRNNTQSCSECGDIPVVKQTGMCGVCTWDDESCKNGNW